MVPFVALLLFLFAEYYVFHGIFCFQYPVLPEIKRKPADDPEDLSGVAGIVCCRSFAELWRTEMSAGHHPATACSGSDRFIHGIRTPPAEAARWTLSCHSLCGKSCTCFLVSCLYGGRGDYAVYLLQPGEAVEKLLLGVPAALLENFGLVGNAKVGSFASLMQLLVWVFLILLGYGLWYVFRKIQRAQTDKRCTDNSPCFCGSHSIYHRDHQRGGGPLLLFMAWFAAAVLVAVMVDHMSEGQPVFAGLILTAVALFAVLNLKYTYYEAATTQDNLKEYQEVADYLTEAGIDYGYAEFWDAERICLITDGRVTMGHSYTMASLSGYWWLTSTNGIPRRCPRNADRLRRTDRNA